MYSIWADGVRGNSTHRLTVDRVIVNYNERTQRDWACTCGDFNITAYDTPAKAAYRIHFKQSQ